MKNTLKNINHFLSTLFVIFFIFVGGRSFSIDAQDLQGLDSGSFNTDVPDLGEPIQELKAERGIASNSDFNQPFFSPMINENVRDVVFQERPVKIEREILSYNRGAQEEQFYDAPSFQQGHSDDSFDTSVQSFSNQHVLNDDQISKIFNVDMSVPAQEYFEPQREQGRVLSSDYNDNLSNEVVQDLAVREMGEERISNSEEEYFKNRVAAPVSHDTHFEVTSSDLNQPFFDSQASSSRRPLSVSIPMLKTSDRITEDEYFSSRERLGAIDAFGDRMPQTVDAGFVESNDNELNSPVVETYDYSHTGHASYSHHKKHYSRPARKWNGQPEWIVQKGDTLSKISKSVFGTIHRWKDIHNMNGALAANPHLIFPGQRFSLPVDGRQNIANSKKSSEKLPHQAQVKMKKEIEKKKVVEDAFDEKAFEEVQVELEPSEINAEIEEDILSDVEVLDSQEFGMDEETERDPSSQNKEKKSGIQKD